MILLVVRAEDIDRYKRLDTGISQCPAILA